MSSEAAADRGELQEQIAALHPRLLRFAQALTRDREEAADLAQEAMVRAIGASWRFTPGTNLVAWLFRITRNLHLNRVRDHAAGPAITPLDDLRDSPEWRDPSSSPVERSVIERVDLADLRRAFDALPEKYALPLLLSAVEGLAYSEVAAILDIPVGTVMSRIYRGRRLLLAGIGRERP